jgi:hypothetical protein
MENKVFKFKDYITNTNEDTYKPDENGKMVKQEWELYKDWHPSKFKVSVLSSSKDTTPFDSGEYVWIIKKNDIIVSILSADINEDVVNTFFNNLKNGKENILT